MSIRTRIIPTARALAALASFAAAAPGLAAPIFVPEDQPIGYVAQPRSTSLDVKDGNATGYFTDYERQHWSGNLRPFHLSAAGVVDGDSDLWPGGAAPAITQQAFGTNGKGWEEVRKIVTLKSDGEPVIFKRSELSSDQQAVLTDKKARYVRGDRANEAPAGDKLRVRRYVLGDIIRSRPVYVAGTNKMLYVGANDGMLHAIDAETGEEVYAYIPSMLIPKLAALAPLNSDGYTHTHFVDASPRTALVAIGGATKRILVGGLGAGGRGLWALNISNDASARPATEIAAAGKIMWEITNTKITVANPRSATASTAYANLGHTYGEPIIGKSNYVVSGTDRDVIFMPNGYMSTTGKATLFVINPANGALIREIDTGTGSAGSPNGLSSPTPVDTNGDGRIDYLYAGDLDGKMWRFDVSATAPASWSVSLLHTTSPAQSITSSPTVAAHPKGGRMVAFGTGRTLMASDMTDTSVHYVYGIWDGAPGSATTLLQQSVATTDIWVDSGSVNIRRVRTLTVNAPDWSTHRGWRTALPAGERVVSDRPTLTNGRVYLHTFNPTVNLDGLNHDPVEPIYENWLYQFNFLTGGGTKTPIFDLNEDGIFNSLDLLPDAGSTPANERAPAAEFLNPGVASQPVVLDTTAGTRVLYTRNLDLPALAIIIGDPGVSGGHFDADAYYPTGFDAATSQFKGYGSRKHVHEYDDKFGVTGVNMLNASDPALNLKNASFSVKQTAPQTQFKVLVMNQYLNPAARLRIGPPGDQTWESVKTYGGQASSSDAQAVLDAAPAYTYSTIGHLVFGLPLDGFNSKDWWDAQNGSPDIRAGLVPTTTGCVNKLSDTPVFGTPGLQGERHNGALTVQLIRADTPASALELNVAGDPRYGWRVKASEFRKHTLAQWTFFWHHPNGKCYGAAGWVKNPPQDVSGGTPGTPPVGTADPQDGAFNSIGGTGGTPGCSGTLASSTTTFNKQTLTQTTHEIYTGGCSMTFIYVFDGTGGVDETVTVNQNGTSSTTARHWQIVEKTDATPPSTTNTGRISWRELVRE